MKEEQLLKEAKDFYFNNKSKYFNLKTNENPVSSMIQMLSDFKKYHLLKKTKTNPYQVIIDLKLEADYLSQESCIMLMEEFAKRELNFHKYESITTLRPVNKFDKV